MPILIFIAVALILALIFGPSLWARWTLKRHSDDRPDFPGTGGELARHLLDQAGLSEVTVESFQGGDHYDPQAKAVRLTPENYDGRSVTAVSVAAHEVGHALQDHDNYLPLRARTELVRKLGPIERIASLVIFAGPVLGLVSRSPLVAGLTIVAGILALGASVVVHLVTLPVEFDASFKRALPILEEGRYLEQEDLPAARQILKACALTYVAASLASLLNLARWIRFLR